MYSPAVNSVLFSSGFFILFTVGCFKDDIKSSWSQDDSQVQNKLRKKIQGVTWLAPVKWPSTAVCACVSVNFLLFCVRK